MDYSIILIAAFFIVVYSYGIWYHYFSRTEKISDQQLMDNYVYLKMKGYLND